MKHSTAAAAAGLVLAAGLINAQPPQAKLGPDAAMVISVKPHAHNTLSHLMGVYYFTQL